MKEGNKPRVSVKLVEVVQWRLDFRYGTPPTFDTTLYAEFLDRLAEAEALWAKMVRGAAAIKKGCDS